MEAFRSPRHVKLSKLMEMKVTIFLNCPWLSRPGGKGDARVGLLILVFYFTSKSLLYYQHLLVNTEQHSKKDLVCEQVEII